MSVEVAMFGLNFHSVRHVVAPSVGRVDIEVLDRRRAASPEILDLRHSSGLNFYLMSPLDADVMVPDDAIDVIKRTLGREFRSNSRVVRALKQLFRSGSSPRTPRWALVEAHGTSLTVRATHEAFSREFLSTDFDHLPDAQGPDRSLRGDMRILVEYVAPRQERQEAVDAEWEQLVARLATYAEAPVPALVSSPADSTATRAMPRDMILGLSVDAAEAARLAGTHAQDATTWASRQRKAGRLFGVWSSSQRAFVHPDFQFTANGGVHGHLGDLLRVLRLKNGFNPATSDAGGWARAYWLYQPRAELSRRALASRLVDAADPVSAALALSLIGDDRPRSPAEAFIDEPLAVIALAQALTDEKTGADD